MYYKMNDDGINNRDAIGDVFYQINELFKGKIKSKGKVADLNSLNPAQRFDKNAAMFIHDIIYFSGPILYSELIQLLILIFGPGNFNKVAHLLAILSAFDSIERNRYGLFRSKLKKTYYDFRFDITSLISTFRNYMLKKYPERLYEY